MESLIKRNEEVISIISSRRITLPKKIIKIKEGDRFIIGQKKDGEIYLVPLEKRFKEEKT